MHMTQAWQDLLRPGDASDFFVRVTMPPFEPDAVGYSRANALWLAELSRLVYRHDAKEGAPSPQPSIDSFLAGANFTKRDFFLDKGTDTQAMLVEYKGDQPFAVLAFRGTEQVLKDLLTDLEIGKLPISGTKKDVHEGFSAALDSVWCEIETELFKLSRNFPLFYTGHSLGAALATLAAAKHPPRALYTFGSPQVGNQAFIDSLPKIPIYRVVNDEDVVTTLPPAFINFQHVGEEQLLPAPAREPLLQHLFDPPKPLADHAPLNYVDRIYNSPA